MKKPNIVPEGTVAVGGEEIVPHAYADERLEREPETGEEAERAGPTDAWTFWSKQVGAALVHEKLFREEAEASEQMYFGPQKTVTATGEASQLPQINEKTALIHGNIDVLKPLVYSDTPQPIVRRRFNGDHKRDETQLMATEAVQRLASYILDTEGFDAAMEAARDDWLIAGRGVATALYKATFAASTDPVTGAPVQRKAEERVMPRHREWKRVLFCPGHAWEDMPWLALENSMTRSQIEKRFPDHAQYFSYNTAGLIGSSEAAEDDDKLSGSLARMTGEDRTNATTISPFDTATVWEIWNRDEKRVIWWSPDCKSDVLDTIDDPLGLENFYPMPAPLLSTTKGRRLTPRPDIRYYEARAEEVEIASRKMSELLSIIAVAGLIPAQDADKFVDLFKGKNQLIPVQAWLTMMQKGSMSELVQWLPLEPIVRALQALQQLREQAKNAMFEASGVSDIMRAQGDPNETATAQQIKGRYAGLRTSQRQKRMAIFALDMLRILLDMATGLFSTEFLAEICGLDLPLTEAERLGEIQRREDEMQRYLKMAELHQAATQMAEEQAAAQAQAQAAAPPPADPMLAGLPGMETPDPMAQAMAPPAMEPPLDPGPPPEPPKYDKPVPDTSWELVHANIKSDLRRKISISIETDSTVLADEVSDKEQRVEFINAFAGFVQTLLPLTSTGQIPMATMKEMLLFGVRGFPKSRTLETLISQLPDEVQSQPQQEETAITVAKIRAEVEDMLQQRELAHETKMKGIELLQDAAHGALSEVAAAPDLPPDPAAPPPARKARK